MNAFFYRAYLLVFLILCFSCKQQGEEKVNIPTQKARPFALSEVQLLDGPFKHATELNERILLGYEPDRLLARFRSEAGLEPQADSYGGWEAESLAGHSLGHYLSACNLMYQTTGNREFLRRSDHIVDELAVCQDKDGEGYIGAIPDGKRIFEEEIARGDIRSQGFDLNGLWAPFYTQHKVLAGLRDAYRLSGNNKALEVAQKFADWVHSVISQLNDDQMQEVLHCEYGGMNEVLVDLYTDTGNEKYLQLADRFYHKEVLDDLMAKKDSLAGLHGNTQFPKVIGLTKRYMATDSERDYEAAGFFWDRVVNHHSYVTGGNTNHEYFGKPDRLSKRLSAETTETCNVYNMLKLTDLLFQLQPGVETMDYYERGLINQILASQDPDTGRVVYYLSLEMGGYKQFQDPFDFTCCVGSAMETHAKYNGHIYYHNDNELYLAQFIASRVDWKEKGVQVIQETAFPEEQGTTLRFQMGSPANFDFKIRYPYWAESGLKVYLNDEPLDLGTYKPGTFVSIKREWKNKDVLEIDFPFALRKESMPDDPNRIAIMYGPLVLAGELGKIEAAEAREADFVPTLLTERKEPSGWLTRTEEPNTFEITGLEAAANMRVTPFYQINDKRYTVYWDIFNKQEWAEVQEKFRLEKEAYSKLEKETYDFFQPGEMQPERNHNFQGEKVYVVEMKDRKARQAERGGWFSFDMKVVADTPMALVFEYWGGYTGTKIFDIQVDGVKVATQDISGIKDGSFLTRRYPVPEDVTMGKEKITVKIMPHPGSRGGPVFGVRTVRR